VEKKSPTSMRLSEATRAELKWLARQWRMSQTGVVEHLVCLSAAAQTQGLPITLDYRGIGEEDSNGATAPNV